MITESLATALVAGAVTAAVPLAYAGIGEQISEEAGVLNVGIEGMMLAGAYAGFVVANDTGLPWLGFLAGAAAGLLVAAPMVVLCVWFALNQIVVGISLTISVEGLTALLHRFFLSRSYPRLPPAAGFHIPLLSDIPVLGSGLFGRHALSYGVVALCCAVLWIRRRSFLGLYLHAAGSAPAGLDARGIRVSTVRSVAVFATGGLAGIAGAYLSEIGAGTFVPFMTNGSGFIAIVLAMLGRGNPFLVLAGALLFGASLSATTALQMLGADVPTDFVQMLPFAVVMLALIVFGKRDSLQAALGTPFRRGPR